ncbi:DUF2975 domain-containing protein [Hyphomonas sp.]|uniref:DUF2975 domain-containing protein n=1 Tax=Hyphomonas sp. TaxID=87 RepID=UPI0025BB2588|nr:DUF2975 domain-containing protein [Hyphomonas sp.]MEE2921768.1 DUF2975 domain-containing protein [Pseudomonadota bacterium]
MSTNAGNSMAIIMTVLVTIVMWITAIVGTIAIALIGMSIIAHYSDGSIQILNLLIEDKTFSISALIAGFLGALIVIPAIIYVCFQLRRILATLSDGDPFVPENARRLRFIAIAIALTQLLTILIQLATPVMFKEATISPRIDLIAWASVAALFILSQVFREGTRLRDEEKMTI